MIEIFPDLTEPTKQVQDFFKLGKKYLSPPLSLTFLKQYNYDESVAQCILAASFQPWRITLRENDYSD